MIPSYVQSYVARGWKVFPCHSVLSTGGCTCVSTSCPEAGKHPRTINGVKNAANDRVQLETWVSMWPEAEINWAVACGSDSNLLVIDVDARKNGEENLAAWEAANGALPATLVTLTGGGGRHLFYSVPPEVAESVRNRVNVVPGVDVRGTGGYVILPPGRHKSGRPYVFKDPSAAVAPATELVHLLARQSTSEKTPVASGAAPPRIPEGQRNEYMFRHACYLRRQLNDSKVEVWGAMHSLNTTACVPPLSPAEVDKIIDSAFSQDHNDAPVVVWRAGMGLSEAEPAEPSFYDDEEGRRNLTDEGNARRLVDNAGADFRYTPGLGWVYWDGLRWLPDTENLLIQSRARGLGIWIREEAHHAEGGLGQSLVKWASISEGAGKIAAAVSLARSDDRIVRSISAYDTYPLLLVCANGVINLETGELLPHNRDLLSTQMTSVEYDPDFTLPAWDDFLKVACDGDDQLVSYLQRAAGYTLTGSTEEEAFFLISGPPASGKSTFVSAMETALGDYAGQISVETLLINTNPGRRDGDLANAFGKRMIATTEVGEGEQMAESVVKQLTGGDAVTARHLYKNPFSYVPQFKLWIATNHDPIIRDQAMWRRVKKIPFPRHLTAAERDPELKALLRDPNVGGRAVLAWAVKGCQAWLESGLAQPERITLETREYSRDQDHLSEFISEMVIPDSASSVPAAQVFVTYSFWAMSTMNEKTALNVTTFSYQMRDKGYERQRIGGRLFLKGLRLRAAPGEGPTLSAVEEQL